MSGRSSGQVEQLAYYRAVAGEYEDHAIDAPGWDELLSAIASFRPTGDVLELACGTGIWTEGLLRSATSVTAVDGAPEMLARAQHRVGRDAAVRFVEADLFSWVPDRRYDAVFFGFWISHVPEDRFASFWSVVARALEPGGRVFFCDDNHRTEAELVEGVGSPVVQRRLNDGTPFRVIKIPYEPAQLERRLRAMRWDIEVTGTSGPFLLGHRRSRHPSRVTAGLRGLSKPFGYQRGAGCCRRRRPVKAGRRRPGRVARTRSTARGAARGR